MADEDLPPSGSRAEDPATSGTEHTAGHDPRWRPSPTGVVVTLILLVAIVVPLLVGTYSRVEPRLFGFPFFYWYQLIWVFLAAGLCALSYLLLKREWDRHRHTDHSGDQR